MTGKAGLKKYGLKAKARMVASASASLHPDYFSEAAIVAAEKVCAKAGLSLADIDLFEINEAFASVALQAIKGLNIPLDKVTPEWIAALPETSMECFIYGNSKLQSR
jgi:acetyl-CoA C-acetyltransferase